MENDDVIDGVEGIINDVDVDQGSGDAEPNPDVAQLKEMVTSLQEANSNIQRQLSGAISVKAERDEAAVQAAQAIAFIEGSGTGKYDKETGQITRIEKEVEGPDQIALLDDKISETENEILKRHRNGDIDDQEYYRELQENVAPLKDDLRDLKSDRKFDDFKKSLTPKQEEIKKQEIIQEATPSKSVAQVTREYGDNIAEYPDADDAESPLFKKMSEIYEKNQNIYTNVNYNGGKGDPKQQKDLIERAVMSLKVDGIEVKKEQSTIRQKFATPGNKGYQAPTKKESAMNKDDFNMVISQGINSKALLKDINSKVTNWENTGAMTMDD